MDKYTATELAFKNGYEQGYKKGYTAAKMEEKHGHWIIHRNGKGRSSMMWVECSECMASGGSPEWKRCPVCEAKMDMPNITAETNAALIKMGQALHGGNDGKEERT